MGYEHFNRGFTAEQVMHLRQHEADERRRERLELDDDLVAVVRPMMAEEMNSDELHERQRHRVF